MTKTDTYGLNWSWWRMPDGSYVNKYGTPVTVMTCTGCGREFSVCPAVTLEQWGGSVCLGDECPSYDISRDVDMFFEPLAEAGLIKMSTNE